MALTEDIFGVLGRWSPAAGARTWKFDCIITLNLCLLRRYIADILHRGLATTQAICYFHSNRSWGNLFRESSFNMTRGGGDEDIETRSLKF